MKNLTFLFFAFIFINVSYCQQDIEIVKADLDKETIKSHIYFLASDELEGRDTPSEGLEKAAGYLAKQLKQSGVKAFPELENYYQPVQLNTNMPPTSIEIIIGEKKVTENSSAYLFNGTNINLEGDIVYVDYGLEQDFIKADVVGKIVVADVGDGKSQNPRDYYFLSMEKSKWAKDAGAKAFIEIFPNIPFPIVGFLTSEKVTLNLESTPKSNIAHIFLDIEKEEIKELLGLYSRGEIIIEGKQSNNFVTYNVVGIVRGIDEKLKDEYIVCTAHYDHVGIGRPDATGDTIYNGARDNAVGVASLLVSAKNVVRNPLKRSVIFVFFTAEEKGLLGSRWFIEHSPVKPEKIVYCFNNDNGSYTDTTFVSIPGLSKINTEEIIKEACSAFGLTATDNFPEANMLYSASDNIHFSKIGIPSITYSLGFTSFNAEVRKIYHQPSDEAETINYNYLYNFCGGYNLSLRFIGNMEEQPFWKAGDDYYEMGEGLYKINH